MPRPLTQKTPSQTSRVNRKTQLRSTQPRDETSWQNGDSCYDPGHYPSTSICHRWSNRQRMIFPQPRARSVVCLSGQAGKQLA